MIQKQNFKKYEIIYVNDGSTDRTREYLENVASSNKQVKVLHL